MTDKNQKAMLTHSSIPPVSGDTPCLDDFLAYARTHSGEDVQGLAFATTGHMTALEFIQEEDKYGNTVVVDQLFTGRWK